MICDRANSLIPGLGYTVTYAVGNTLLTIWGMVPVVMMTWESRDDASSDAAKKRPACRGGSVAAWVVWG